MTAVLVPREHSQFSPDPLKAPTAQRYFLDLPVKSPMQNDYPVSPLLSPNFSPIDLPTTTLSLDEDLILPAYGDGARKNSIASDASETPWACGTPAADDSSVEDEPSRHVDYLSHDWREEDIWSSWRYVAARKNDYSNGARLENASWRTWAKAKNNLGTISPETLHWYVGHLLPPLPGKGFPLANSIHRLKDCDVTWLYGPLKTSASSDAMASDVSPPPSRLETPNSYLEPKPILKKKTASETMLQRSLSQHTLLQHAGAILKAQEAEQSWTRPPLPRSNTDLHHLHHRTGSSTYSLGGTLTSSSSGMTSPSERRHIHFNNEVVQCIAVEAKSDEIWPMTFDESSSDDGVVMMRQASSDAFVSNRSTPRNSFSGESKTIAPLPSTTLKYRGDTPEPREPSILDRWAALSSSPTSTSPSSLSPTPSVETLRPPSANFLLDDDEDPSLDFTGQYRDRQAWFVPEEEDELADRPLHLSPSGMFVPYEAGGEPEGPVNHTILGRVVDTVNTARDIAHVIWNVGWRR
ncbi:hypothetical protein N7490_011402 [Penicillium lividum]|nr:hypothetical protein N7490_011402 [Penicillium lividum]